MSHKLKVVIMICALLFIGVSDTKADTILLKNKRSIEGIIIKQEGGTVLLDVGFGVVTFQQDEIEQIRKLDHRQEAKLRERWAKEKIDKENVRKKIEAQNEALPKKVNVDKVMGHVMVSALLDGKVNANLLLDTGASLIVLSPNIVKQLGYDLNKEKGEGELILADGRRVKTKYIVLKSVKVQDAVVDNVEAAIMPEDVKAEEFKDGVLGMSFLKRFNFKINYDEGKLILEKTR